MPRSRSLVVDGVDVVKRGARRSSTASPTSHERVARRERGSERRESRSAQRRQHRDRRERPRPGDGVRGAPHVRRARARRCASSRTSTPPTLDERDSRASSRPRRSSSSSRRRCRRSRRSRTRARARAWVEAALGRGRRRARTSSGLRRTRGGQRRSGFRPSSMLRIWDWVGGRTSLCSAVGLSLVDRARRGALPRAAWRVRTRWTSTSRPPRSAATSPRSAGLLVGLVPQLRAAPRPRRSSPYSHALRLLPAYLQQLWMESNGKRVTTDGEPVEADTGSVLWGGEGTNAQHAVFQLLHQGTMLVPVDLIGFAHLDRGLGGAARPARRESLRAGRGARVRPHGGRAARGGRARGDDPASRDAGKPPDVGDPRRAPRPGDARGARRALRAQRLHAGRDLGHQPLRPVGRRAREGARRAHRARARPRTGSTSCIHDSSTNALVRRYRTLRDGS